MLPDKGITHTLTISQRGQTVQKLKVVGNSHLLNPQYQLVNDLCCHGYMDTCALREAKYRRISTF